MKYQNIEPLGICPNCQSRTKVINLNEDIEYMQDIDGKFRFSKVTSRIKDLLEICISKECSFGRSLMMGKSPQETIDEKARQILGGVK